MSFDEQSDADPHGECRLEIDHLRDKINMLERHLVGREQLLDEAIGMLENLRSMAELERKQGRGR